MNNKTTVADLIELLKDMPQDMAVGYVNVCADEGTYVVTIDSADVFKDDGRKYAYPRYPKEGIVVLS